MNKVTFYFAYPKAKRQDWKILSFLCKKPSRFKCARKRENMYIAKKYTVRRLFLTYCFLCVSVFFASARDYLVSSLQKKDGLSDNFVTCACADNRHRLFVGTRNGLNVYDGSLVSRVGNSDFEITTLYCDDEVLYVGAENGLYEYSPESDSLVPVSVTTQWGVDIYCHVSGICRCANNIVVGTIGQGFFLLDMTNRTLKQFSTRIPFVTNLVSVSGNNVVVASRDEGLLSVNLSAMSVTEICNVTSARSLIYASGRIWCVIGDGRAGYVEDGAFHQVLTDVLELSEYDGGHIVATCSDCLVLLDSRDAVPDDKWNLFYGTQRVSGFADVCNTRDYEGNLWIPLQSSGLVKLPVNRIALYDGNALEQNPDPHFCVGGDGNSYRAVKNQVFKYDVYGKTADVYFKDMTPQVLFADKDGIVWVGTRENGLRRGFVPVPVETTDGQVSCVYSIKQDEYGFLWLACNLGIVRLDSQSLQARVIAGHEILPQSESFVPEKAPVASDGTIRFLTTEHTLVFASSSYCNPREVPCAEITSIGFRTSSDVIRVEGGSTVHIPYTGNSFVINLALPSYLRPESNSFRYMLSDVDDSMSSWSKHNSVSYNGLKPGKYKFTVEGMSGDGLVSAQANVYDVVIDPLWWNSNLAIACYILTAVLLAVFTVLLIIRRVRADYASKLQASRQRVEAESYKQKMNFFLGMVHEIRTPMTMMRLSLEKMSKAGDQTAKNQAEKILVENLNNIGETINGILNYQNTESQGAQLLMIRTDLTELCAGIVGQFESMAKMKGLELSAVLPSEPVYVMADEMFFSKILNNLASNALKYARKRIEFYLSVEHDSAVIRVNDDGPGVNPKYRDKIFDMFYKVSGDKVAEASGMGIGLAYSRQLAQAHGASITEENLPGRGASFIVEIPLMNMEKSSLEGEVSNDLPIREEPSEVRDSVLVVEDNISLCSALEEELSEWFVVYKASNGAEALNVLESVPVDIIVSDVMMPVMDGLELCRTVKQRQEFNHIPFVMLTAKVSIQAKVEGLNCGADAYVEKPFSIAQIKSQIENLLKLREAARGAVMAGVGTGDASRFDYVSNADREFLGRIDGLIENQLKEEDFSIDALAEEMCMSKSNFYRKFHAVTGSSPNEYLKNFRLNRAAKLIREGLRINEAATSVGFYSSSYFAKCFYAKFGVLPKDYSNGYVSNAVSDDK